MIRFEGRKEEQPGSYTHLEYVCEKEESEALPLRTKAQKKEATSEKPAKKSKLEGKTEAIKELKTVQGKSVKEIAKMYEVSQQAIYDVLNGKR